MTGSAAGACLADHNEDLVLDDGLNQLVAELEDGQRAPLLDDGERGALAVRRLGAALARLLPGGQLWRSSG